MTNIYCQMENQHLLREKIEVFIKIKKLKRCVNLSTLKLRDGYCIRCKANSLLTHWGNYKKIPECPKTCTFYESQRTKNILKKIKLPYLLYKFITKKLLYIWREFLKLSFWERFVILLIILAYFSTPIFNRVLQFISNMPH